MSLDLASFDFFLLFLLSFTGGLLYAWLGAGAGAILVPLLPYVSHLSALGVVQTALLMGFLISLFNSGVFWRQKLILWSWIFKALFFILISSFLAGFCIGFLSPFQIRFLLWSFFLLILLLPFLLNGLNFISQNESGNPDPAQNNKYKMSFFYVFNILAGCSSGLTGVGGGMILSPFFHESRLVPPKNIPAVMSVLLLCVTGFSLLGQITQSSLSFNGSSEIFLVCLKILPGYFLGSLAGYIINIKQNSPHLRRRFLRFLVLLLFLKMTLEILKPVLPLLFSLGL